MVKSLKLNDLKMFVQSFNRTNLLFRVEKKPDKAADAMQYVADFIKKQNTTTWGRCEEQLAKNAMQFKRWVVLRCRG